MFASPVASIVPSIIASPDTSLDPSPVASADASPHCVMVSVPCGSLPHVPVHRRVASPVVSAQSHASLANDLVLLFPYT